jgi:iron(III) transport system substrate-binding protein
MHSKHPAEAQRFLEWLATDGQNVLVDANHEYPANPNVPAEPLITERFGTDFVRDPLDAATFGALNPDAIRLMDEAGYD